MRPWGREPSCEVTEAVVISVFVIFRIGGKQITDVDLRGKATGGEPEQVVGGTDATDRRKR